VPPAILATIDETPYTITEDLVRTQLQLADDSGIDDLPIAEIYSGMDNLGYVTEGKLTFYKNKFSPQWRFLVHTILHCLSTKSGSWALRWPKALRPMKEAIGEKAKVESFTDAQLKEEIEKIQKALANTQSTEATIPSVPDVPHPPVVSSPNSSSTRRKSLGRNQINALYKSDQSTKYFTTLREILHIVDRQYLLKLYGMVVTYYENRLVTGAGLMLWGDLQVLIDYQEGGKGSLVCNHQSLWQIRSWRLYTLSNVHVLETVSGEVLYMFADVSYPLSVKLMERMLKHKLEIDKDVVGNDMTTAEQLIRFIKNQIAAAQVSPV
ncbi:hypothetical protein Tco_0887348, partial [Tanacetum coccineum]